MGTVEQFIGLLTAHGSSVIFHREDAGSGTMIPCPCQTPEGQRDPEWHDANPAAPICNERGFLPPGITELSIKGFVQPIQSTRATRLSTEFTQAMFGTLEGDDHLGIFPESWQGNSLDFYDWSQSGDEYVRYNNRDFLVVNANLIPDPADGNPRHHWEVGLRLIGTDTEITGG